MALNPDDLLIFSERNEKEKKAAKPKAASTVSAPPVKEREAPPQQEKPKPQAPASQKPAPQPPKIAQPKPSISYYQARPASQSAPSQEQPKQSQGLQAQKSVQQPQASSLSGANAYTSQTPASSFSSQQRSTKKEELSQAPRNATVVQEQGPTLSSIYASIQPSEEEIESIINNEFSTSGAGIAKKTKISRSEEQSRQEAKGQTCVWHPWRPAYAICNYCSRPFCYEDIVEYNNNYYCLEDIDKVSTGASKETSVKYNNLSIISASFFVLSFLLFVYFANAQVAYVVKYANGLGFFDFLAKMNFAYGITILGTVLSVFNLVAGILIFARSEKWFSIGFGIAAFDIFVFSYGYLNTTRLYEIMIAISSFVALITLLVSREVYESVPSSLPESSYLQEMSTASNF
ncbi:MAG: hypothetical protein ACP5UC_00010 [Candidatus Micrarchaeia archaeon]